MMVNPFARVDFFGFFVGFVDELGCPVTYLRKISSITSSNTDDVMNSVLQNRVTTTNNNKDG
jgi:hypothetical protein